MTANAPHGWTRCSLGDAVTLQRGFDLPKAKRLAGDVPIVSSSGVSGWHAEAKVSAPGVVTGRTGTLGKVFFVEQDFWPLNTALWVKDFKGNDPAFTAALLQTIDFLAYSDKTSVPGVNRNHLHLATVLLPPVDEQRRISAALGALDAKVAHADVVSRRLGELVGTLFEGLFGECLGTTRLGDLCELVKGRSYKTAELNGDDTALVTLKSFHRDGGYAPRGLKSYSGPFKPAQVISPGELIVALTDLTQAADVIGRPAIVPDRGAYSTIVASLDVGIVRPTTQGVTKLWLHELLRTPRYVANAKAQANGSTVLHLPKAAITDFEVGLPATAALDEFERVAAPAYERIAAVRAEARRLQEVRDLLLRELVTGRVRVAEDFEPDAMQLPVG